MALTSDQIAAIAAGAAVVTALITGISAIVALFALWGEAKRSNLGRDAELTLELEDRFNRPEMRRMRALAAASYLAGKPGREFDDILNLFELAGALAWKKAIGVGGLHIILGDFVCAYWSAARPYIEASRSKAPTLWNHVAYLNDRFVAMEGLPGGTPMMSPDQLQSFMQAEARLPN